MTASARGSLSRTTLNVPFPLEVEETKIHPSLARRNINGLLDLRTEETSSNSETRLFSFFSPAKTTFASEAAANRFRRIGNRTEAMTRTFMKSLDAFLTRSPRGEGRAALRRPCEGGGIAH